MEIPMEEKIAREWRREEAHGSVYRSGGAEKRWYGLWLSMFMAQYFLWRGGRSTAEGTSDLLNIIYASYS